MKYCKFNARMKVSETRATVLCIIIMHYIIETRCQTNSIFCTAFSPKPAKRFWTRIHGINEWRDNVFSDIDIAPGKELRKPICILPFGSEESLLQGQTKELQLYEDRFLKLFDKVMNEHESVVAMGLMSEEDQGLYHAVPICEVIDYNNMGGELGIFLTIRCVGRAELLDIRQDDPYLILDCIEIVDEGSPKTNISNVVADDIENMVKALHDIEERLSERLEDQAKEGTLPESISVYQSSDDFYDGDDDGPNRLQRYSEAVQKALDSDAQGYFSPIADDETQENRSTQELTAISWAAFSTESTNELDDFYRVQALATRDLLDRLKLGLLLLNEKFKLVENVLKMS
mmetsp:Transcript_10226/g.15703  ORF Transcript_10226/g.15703 Transcript_10226/m.15703 type:complete len:345 (+) Transcript_10226:153-1187(+)